MKNIIPEKGKSFIGWKKAKTKSGKSVILKLRIPASADRVLPSSSGFYSNDGKCRSSKAKVLKIFIEKYDNKKGFILKSTNLKTAYSIYYRRFKYVVGKTVIPSYYDSSEENICSGGIHFFLNKRQAIDYQ